MLFPPTKPYMLWQENERDGAYRAAIMRTQYNIHMREVGQQGGEVLSIISLRRHYRYHHHRVEVTKLAMIKLGQI